MQLIHDLQYQRWEGEANVRSGLQQPKERSRRPQRGGGMQKLSKTVLKIAIFRELEAAIGKDCRVLTRKKSGQRPQGLAYDFKDTTRTSFLQGWWSRWSKSSSMRIGTGGGQDVPGSVAERFRIQGTPHGGRHTLYTRFGTRSKSVPYDLDLNTAEMHHCPTRVS